MTLVADLSSTQRAPAAPVYEADGAIGSRDSRSILLVPSEDILVVAVDLPLAGLRQRLAALPFALEDLVSEPLAAIHLALGSEIAPKRHLAAIVRRDVMDRHVGDLTARDAANCRIVPDIFAVPVPLDAAWAAVRQGDRTLVRCADGTGFAMETDLLATAWRLAGSPSIVSHGESLPIEMAARSVELDEAAVVACVAAAPIDLRQGAYAAPRTWLPPIVRWIGLLAAVGLFVHVLVALVDLMALNAIVDAREQQARSLIAVVAPNLPAGIDVVDAINRIEPSSSTRTGEGFLPLMAKTSAALTPFAGRINIQSLAFASGDGALSMTIEGPDLATLQAIEEALDQAGLNPSSGPATTERGAAEFRITVRSAGGTA